MIPPGPDEYHWTPFDGPDYLPTYPGTYLEFASARPRRGRCWRCRLWLRWPPWRRHWGCRKHPRLVYLVDGKPR